MFMDEQNVKLISGDCLDVLKTLESDSVDSLITDPPAGISFMGKAWDDDKGGRKQWIAWMSEVMTECKRVLKPGAHALVWAIPRTSHWTATALEDAGFEIRDVVTHLFGSGFPKSLDISKAIDKAAGAEREVVGLKTYGEGHTFNGGAASGRKSGVQGKTVERAPSLETAPATPEAKRYQGWGTALKPASEHWILVRKPLSEKTVAANTLKHGTGGINIDGCRVHSADAVEGRKRHGGGNPNVYGKYDQNVKTTQPAGRFPANLVLSHNDDCTTTEDLSTMVESLRVLHGPICTPTCAVKMLDEQSGILKTGGGDKSGGKTFHGQKYKEGRDSFATDSGGASRFFYVAKASKSDKGKDNTHPTVKATKLMSYLIKLITPINGVVLDPFLGSGSTGVAAIREGFRFIGIEKELEYLEIAKKRVQNER